MSEGKLSYVVGEQCCARSLWKHDGNHLGHGSFGSLPNAELHRLSLFKGTVALSLNSGEVHKDVLLIIGLGDKSEAFRGIKPFYSSLRGGSSEAAVGGESETGGGNRNSGSKTAKIYDDKK